MNCATASRFAIRNCPNCGSGRKTTLVSLEAGNILGSNWSYRKNAMDLLQIGKGEGFPIEECQSCRFIYAGLLPDKEFLAKLYEEVIDGEKAQQANLSPQAVGAKMADLATLLRIAGCHTPRRALDYGCGFGATSLLLSLIPSFEVVAYDTSARRVNKVRQSGVTVSENLDDVALHGPFDILVLDNVLEHVPSPRETLAFINQVSATNAVLFVSVPAGDRTYLLSQARRLDGNRQLAMDVNPWEHLNYFDLCHLDKLAGDFGFVPCDAASVPGPVDIGLRPLRNAGARVKNAAASLLRLASYALRGEVPASVNRRFYRRQQ